MTKLWIIIAGLLGAGAVAVGAFHAHGLEDFLNQPFARGEDDPEYIQSTEPEYDKKLDLDENGRLEPAEVEAHVAKQMHNADVAVKYQMYHALAILGVGILLTRNRGFCWFLLNSSALVFLLGMLGFSGGLYTDVFDLVDLHWSVVPIGGLLMIVGWLLLALAGIFVAIERSDDE